MTGRSLPETLGARIRSRWARRAYWLQAELVAMATDIAEVIGGAVALNLLFGIPLLWGGVITGTVSITLLLIQSRRGPRPFEFVIIGLLAIIAIGFSFGVFVAPPDGASVVRGPGAAVRGHRLGAAPDKSILGATMMPHAIYAHSALAEGPLRAPPALTKDGSARPRTSRSLSERGTSETKRAEQTADDGLQPLERPVGAGRDAGRAARHPDAPPAARDEVGRVDRDAHRRHG